MFGLRNVWFSPKVAIYVAGGFFSMAYRNGDRSLAGHHIATGKYAFESGHHIEPHHDGAVILPLYARQTAQKPGIGVLPKGQDEGVGFNGFIFSGRYGLAVFNPHHFNREGAAVDFLNGAQPVNLNPFLQSLFGFKLVGRHMLAVSPVNDHGFVYAHTFGGTGSVHGSIAATVDGHASA